VVKKYAEDAEEVARQERLDYGADWLVRARENGGMGVNEKASRRGAREAFGRR